MIAYVARVQIQEASYDIVYNGILESQVDGHRFVLKELPQRAFRAKLADERRIGFLGDDAHETAQIVVIQALKLSGLHQSSLK